MGKVLKEEIISIEKIAPAIFRIRIKSDYTANNAMPGQFINIKCGEGITPLLRRPISICDVNREEGSFDIIFQIKGTGTEYLAQLPAGGRADIIAPLGKPFDLSDSYNKIAVVGGGIGIFPLLFLLKERKAAVSSAFLGFRSKDYAVLTDEFEKAANNLYISTDDGSLGRKGTVCDQLEKDILEKKYDLIYACGPMPMLKKVVEIARDNDIKCQVSLEQRMGCGIGACLVCACKTKLGDDWEYSHVCKDGPVFWSSEVIFDE